MSLNGFGLGMGAVSQVLGRLVLVCCRAVRLGFSVLEGRFGVGFLSYKEGRSISSTPLDEVDPEEQ